MSEVAVSNSYASQAAYNTQVNDTQNSQAATKLDNSAVQGSVDQAIVDALLSMLGAMAHNQGLPKNVLNQLIDFLQNYLMGGGTKPVEGGGAGGIQPVGGSAAPQPEFNAPLQDDAVHLGGHGASAKVGDQEVVMWNVRSQPPKEDGKIYLTPGQSVTIGDTQVVADKPVWSDFPPPSHPPVVDPGFGPVIDTPVQEPVQPPAQPIMSPQDFADRFTVRVQMNDGSWTQVTNSQALEAFGIPVGTLMRDVDLTKLRPLSGAEGTVTAPLSRNVSNASASTSSAASAPVLQTQSQVASGMGEAAGLLNKINSGNATHEDVKAFLSKLNEIAQLFGEAVGDGASQNGKIKGKKGVAGQAEAGVGGASNASSGVQGGVPAGAGLAGIGVPVGAAAAGAGTPTTGAAGGEQVAPEASTGFDTTQGVAGGFSGSTTGKSWLMAIAEAMGNVLGSKVQQMLTASGRMSSLTYDAKGLGAQSDKLNDKLNDYLESHKGAAFNADEYAKLKDEVKPAMDKIDTAMKANGQEFTVESSKLQGASQEFSMLQNAFSNAIKSIGEGLGQLARKG